MTHTLTLDDTRSAAFAAAATEHGYASAGALMTAVLATQADRFIKIAETRAAEARAALLRKLPKADLDAVDALVEDRASKIGPTISQEGTRGSVSPPKGKP